MILKNGAGLGAGNKSYHFFLQDKETGNRLARFPTYQRCKEEKLKQSNPDNFEIIGDWIFVRG